VRLKDERNEKFPIKPANFHLLAQCLNQLRTTCNVKLEHKTNCLCRNTKEKEENSEYEEASKEVENPVEKFWNFSLEFYYFNRPNDRDLYLYQRVRLVLFCSKILSEDGTPVPKHVRVSYLS
jgi:hypothetical protein